MWVARRRSLEFGIYRSLALGDPQSQQPIPNGQNLANLQELNIFQYKKECTLYNNKEYKSHAQK